MRSYKARRGRGGGGDVWTGDASLVLQNFGGDVLHNFVNVFLNILGVAKTFTSWRTALLGESFLGGGGGELWELFFSGKI